MKRRSDHRVKRCLTQGALQSEHKPEHKSVHIKEGHEPQPARQRVSQRASIPLTGTLLRLELACEQFPDRIRFNTPGTDLMGTDLMRELSFLRPAPVPVQAYRFREVFASGEDAEVAEAVNGWIPQEQLQLREGGM